VKKIVVTAVTLGLLAGAMIAPADAAKKKRKPVVRIEEVVEFDYTGGQLGASTPAYTGGACLVDPTQPFACHEIIPPSAALKFVKIEVIDASGQKAGGFISQGDTDGDGIGDGYGQFCGAHTESVPLTVPGAVVGVSLYAGVCSDASGPSVVTTGTVRATFSNLP
jgi:hypothetical protein